jgi:hypothetical protein
MTPDDDRISELADSVARAWLAAGAAWLVVLVVMAAVACRWL